MITDINTRQTSFMAWPDWVGIASDVLQAAAVVSAATLAYWRFRRRRNRLDVGVEAVVVGHDGTSILVATVDVPNDGSSTSCSKVSRRSTSL